MSRQVIGFGIVMFIIGAFGGGAATAIVKEHRYSAAASGRLNRLNVMQLSAQADRTASLKVLDAIKMDTNARQLLADQSIAQLQQDQIKIKESAKAAADGAETAKKTAAAAQSCSEAANKRLIDLMAAITSRESYPSHDLAQRAWTQRRDRLKSFGIPDEVAGAIASQVVTDNTPERPHYGEGGHGYGRGGRL